MDDIVIRPFANVDEQIECTRLQKIVWGSDTVMDANTITAVQRHGGIALGAFDGAGRMLGFVVSFLADAHDPHARRGLSQHSHIAAVLPELKGTGLGLRLKRAQRDAALARGINLITWTFDPLESRNAAFNLRKLGAMCRTYLVNAYGVMNDALNRGLPSDRFEMEWWLDDAAPWRGGRDAPSDAREVEVPMDFQAIKRADLNEALAWRLRTRAHFLDAFGQGYVATGFAVRGERGYYLLTRW